ncbi:hypothetical protein N9L68_05565 [bacterium]|nr:hypothetical protein [bacterium]
MFDQEETDRADTPMLLETLAVKTGKDAELDLYHTVELEVAYGHGLENNRWAIRFNENDGSNVMVQPNDSTAIEALTQKEGMTVRARLTVRQYRWRERREYVPSATRLVDMLAAKFGQPTSTSDATRAFWPVPQTEKCFVNNRGEWLARHVANEVKATDLWPLKRWLDGQRWSDWQAAMLVDMDFAQHIACPDLFYNEARSIVIEAHADDGYRTGPTQNVEELEKEYSANIKCQN